MGTGSDEAALVHDLEAIDPAARTAEELDAIRRRVINVIGHALRTPVTTMAGMAQALGRADDATRLELVDGIARSASRIEGLLDDLLLAAGVTTALPLGDASPMSVRGTFEVVWSTLGDSQGLAFDGPDVAALIRAGSFERIAHVVLDNALKYGYETITVTTEATAAGVRIEVASVGNVPSDDELEHAFELFYRGEHAVMAAPGLGVGLSVARELAHAENGEIGLERRGDAIVATVELPA